MKQNAAGFMDWEQGFLKLSKELVKDDKIKENLLFTIMCYGCLRVGDGLSLTLSQLESDIITLHETKTGKFKKIPSRPEIKLALKLFKKKYPERIDCLFLNERGSKLISSQYINRFLKECLVKYDLKINGKISSHIFRKTFARHIIDKNPDNPQALALLMTYLNHSSISTTMIYLGIQEEEVFDLVLSV